MELYVHSPLQTMIYTNQKLIYYKIILIHLPDNELGYTYKLCRFPPALIHAKIEFDGFEDRNVFKIGDCYGYYSLCRL